MGRSKVPENIDRTNEWFDIKRYKGLDQFNLNDWYLHLSCRYWMQGMLEHSDVNINKINSNSEDNDLTLKHQRKFNEYAELIQKQPLVKIDSFNDTYTFEREVVREFSVLDMEYWINDDWFNTSYEYMDITSDAMENDEIYAFVAKPVNEHLKNAHPDEDQEYAYLSVNLNTQDKVILEKFKSWLSSQRKAEAKTLKLKKYDKGSLKDWCEKKILPFLDIKIISEIKGQRLTLEQCAEILDIQDYKTINKNANFLSSLHGLHTIRNQLHQQE